MHDPPRRTTEQKKKNREPPRPRVTPSTSAGSALRNAEGSARQGQGRQSVRQFYGFSGGLAGRPPLSPVRPSVTITRDVLGPLDRSAPFVSTPVSSWKLGLDQQPRYPRSFLPLMMESLFPRRFPPENVVAPCFPDGNGNGWERSGSDDKLSGAPLHDKSSKSRA
jgi:hypothetical protein